MSRFPQVVPSQKVDAVIKLCDIQKNNATYSRRGFEVAFRYCYFQKGEKKNAFSFLAPLPAYFTPTSPLHTWKRTQV